MGPAEGPVAMVSHARGRLSPSSINARFPYQVGLPQMPRDGATRLYEAIRDWLQARGQTHHTQWGEDRTMVYCFSDPATAEAFKVAFNGEPGRPLSWPRPKRAR